MNLKGHDHLFLDLDHASFLSADAPSVTRKIRDEIKAVCRFFLEAIPGATLLLTGSLSVGEGKISRFKDRISIRSDYDMAVVTPSVRHAVPSFLKRTISDLKRKVSLSTTLEVSLIWRFLLEHHLTTTAGRIVAGREDLGPVMETLRPPRPGNSLAMAYLYFLKATLHPSEDSLGLSKTLLRGAQAFLFHQYRFSDRKEWGRISSLQFCADRIVLAKELFGEEGIKIIQTAAGHLLGKGTPCWREKDYVLTGRLLAAMEPIVFPAPGWHEWLKHFFWLWRRRGIRRPVSHGTGICIRGLRLMAEAWTGSEMQREAGLREASQLAALLGGPIPRGGENDIRLDFENLSDLLEDYLSFYPNKISYAPGPS